VRLYLDGVEESALTYAHPLPATTTPLYLGNNKNPTDGEPMIGRLDDVLLYSEALPAAAIAAWRRASYRPGAEGATTRWRERPSPSMPSSTTSPAFR
jgi:hypothetical protein